MSGSSPHTQPAGIDPAYQKHHKAMLDLSVAVRFVDEKSRPAKSAAAAIERFGDTAKKITARVTGLAKATRGLASAMREVRVADGAAGAAAASTGRLRHHDERQVADIMHRKFQDAVHSQLQ